MILKFSIIKMSIIINNIYIFICLLFIFKSYKCIEMEKNHPKLINQGKKISMMFFAGSLVFSSSSGIMIAIHKYRSVRQEVNKLFKIIKKNNYFVQYNFIFIKKDCTLWF